MGRPGKARWSFVKEIRMLSTKECPKKKLSRRPKGRPSSILRTWGPIHARQCQDSYFPGRQRLARSARNLDYQVALSQSGFEPDRARLEGTEETDLGIGAYCAEGQYSSAGPRANDIKEAWSNIPETFVLKLMESIPARLKACRKAGGWYTHYCVRIPTQLFIFELVVNSYYCECSLLWSNL